MQVLQDVENEGLIGLLGKEVTLMCGNYFYAGKLTGVNEDCVKLEGAKVVYETGPLNTPDWKDAQPLPNDWYVMKAAIESFGVLK